MAIEKISPIYPVSKPETHISKESQYSNQQQKSPKDRKDNFSEMLHSEIDKLNNKI